MTKKFPTETAYHCAFEFTKTALEQKMISHSTDPKISAKNTVDYFNTIFESLRDNNDDQSEK